MEVSHAYVQMSVDLYNKSVKIGMHMNIPIIILLYLLELILAI